MKRGTQKQIAERQGVHPSTVSRRIAKNDIPTTVEGLFIESRKNIITNDIQRTSGNGQHNANG